MESKDDFSQNIVKNKNVLSSTDNKEDFLLKKIKKQRRYPTKYSGKQRFLSTKYSGKQRRLPLITLGSKDDFSKNPGNHRRLLWNFPGNKRQK